MAGKASKDGIIGSAGFSPNGQITVDAEIPQLAESFKAHADLIRVKAARVSIVVISVDAVSSASP